MKCLAVKFLDVAFDLLMDEVAVLVQSWSYDSTYTHWSTPIGSNCENQD
jgi:hypothetical protein